MKYIVLLFAIFSLSAATAQTTLSSNRIKYQVTFDNATSTYTVWVVPQYNTPNTINTTSIERGPTAQVSIAVPRSFVIQNIQDLKGIWDKQPIKLGPGVPNQNWSAYSLDPNTNYYVIGKTPTETTYGTFSANVPIALFSFQGNSCYGDIRILSSTDPFIAAANAAYQLGVENSFYSLSGQPGGGNQEPLEQFAGVQGAAAACSLALQANADNTTTGIGVAKNISVLSNDTRNMQPASINDVTVGIVTNPANGSVFINASGTITYTPNAGFTGNDCFTYRICDKTQPTNCSTAQACVNVTNTLPQTDLAVTKSVSKTQATVGENMVYYVTVENRGTQTATAIQIEDMLPAGVEYISHSATQGTYSTATGLWAVPSLTASQNAVLTIQVKVLQQGVTTNAAKLFDFSGIDTNSSNNSASACTSVPVTICQGQELSFTISSEYTNVKWYSNSTLVASGNTIKITQAGQYTAQATNSNCPATGCCPVIVTSKDCCPPAVCVPLTIQKVK